MPVQFSPDQSVEQITDLSARCLDKKRLESDFFRSNQRILTQDAGTQYRCRHAGMGRAPGTFGELLQGALAGDSNNFLVTFPISKQTAVTFEPHQIARDASRDIQTVPAGKHKSIQLVRRLLADQGINVGGTLTFLEQLPEGKGLASSSADMVASARAVADCYRFEVSEAYLSALLREIEPTDGVMYDECVSFFHRRCELIEKLGALPPLQIVGIDEGSTIDTIEFNATAHAHSGIELDEYSRLLRMISTAVGTSDKRTIGKVSTRSAEINQKYNPKHFLQLAITVAEALDALGVVVAHSGTYVGVLLDPEREDADCQLAQVQIAMSQSALPVEVFRAL